MPGLYHKILVPLDGSEVASQALPHGVELAACSGAELVLFRVVQDLKTGVGITGLVPIFESPVEQQQYLVDHAIRWLERICADPALRHLKVVPVVDSGDAADRIVDFAMSEGVDLIVMSTHGHTGVARWRYGSVANKVLELVKCPVLLIHAQLPGENGKAAHPSIAAS